MSDAQVLLVTGPTGTMGEAVVTRLAGAGHRLFLAARNETRLPAGPPPQTPGQLRLPSERSESP